MFLLALAGESRSWLDFAIRRGFVAAFLLFGWCFHWMVRWEEKAPPAT
jgi:hypothetical protein